MKPSAPVFSTVAGRLFAGFGFLLLLLVALASLAAVELAGVYQRMNQIVEVNNRRSDQARELLDSINSVAIQARSITMMTDMGAIDGEIKTLKTSAEAYRRQQAALHDALAQEVAESPARRLLAEIDTLAKKTLPELMAAAEQGADGDSVAATMTLTQKARPSETQWRAKVAAFGQLQADAAAQAVQAARAAKQRAFVVGAALVLLALCAGLWVAWRITRGIQQPMAQALAVAERIADGDLSTDVPAGSADELGRLLQAVATMQRRLRVLVGDIRASSESIQVASSEVASGNADLSQRTEQTASSLQQTASSLTQLTGTVRGSADSAAQANQLAARARDVALRGGEVVAQVVQTMEQINQASRRIADIIGTIDGIAFQTNILALNAAVEAARAGEQGRGFAVVASEVRGLAGRSAEAAREIKALIGGSVERVEAGSRLVGDAGTTMGEIVASVQRVSDMIGEITHASAEQSSGIGQVNNAVTQLDQMTQQNAALVEQSAAAAESLRDQAARLAQVVATFRLERAAI